MEDSCPGYEADHPEHPPPIRPRSFIIESYKQGSRDCSGRLPVVLAAGLNLSRENEELPVGNVGSQTLPESAQKVAKTRNCAQTRKVGSNLGRTPLDGAPAGLSFDNTRPTRGAMRGVTAVGLKLSEKQELGRFYLRLLPMLRELRSHHWTVWALCPLVLGETCTP